MDNTRQTRTIAVCGKGGVGKTSVTALMVKLLAKRGGLKILAVDADPSIGLATALGVEVKKTVDDIRNELIAKVKKGERYDKSNISEVLNMLDYEVFDALSEDSHFALLAIGRPESSGCYCQVNDLLKDIIKSLSQGFDVVLIDGEAGVEQVNRRVMKTVDDLVLVSDTSAKGINVVSTIKHVAYDNKAMACQRVGLVLNRVRNEEEVNKILNKTTLELLGWIPEDDYIREYDFDNTPLLKLPDTSPSNRAVEHILETLAI
ncbi:MAG: AAA family ATPase [Deltaproteobacteria bacterium]|nr:AAA family ATPase [Deltaproteobacteria bacterium]